MKKKLTKKQVKEAAERIVQEVKELQKDHQVSKEELNKAKVYIYHSLNKLTQNHPLVYGILSRCNIKPRPGLKTFGVMVNNGGIDLLYDPKTAIEWYETTSNQNSFYNKLCYVLQHEAYHLVFGHLTLGLPSEINIKKPTQKDMHLKQLFNIAQDFKINENIPEIWNGDAQGQMFDGNCGKVALKKLLNLEATGEHNSLGLYELLKKQAQDKQLNKTLDDHDLGEGETLSEEEAEKVRAEVQRIIKRSAEQLSEQERCLLPGEIQKILDSLNAPKLNKRKWQDLLKQFICSVRKPTKEGTWKRPSRRFGFKSKGKKHDAQPNLALCLDTSGSMSEDDVQKVIGLVNSYSHKFGQIHLIAGDTEVCYSDLITKSNSKNKLMDFKTGRGGTILQPLIDEAKRKAVHGIIIVSDGYCEALNPHCKTIGLKTSGGIDIPGINNNLTLDEMIS